MPGARIGSSDPPSNGAAAWSDGWTYRCRPVLLPSSGMPTPEESSAGERLTRGSTICAGVGYALTPGVRLPGRERAQHVGAALAHEPAQPRRHALACQERVRGGDSVRADRGAPRREEADHDVLGQLAGAPCPDITDVLEVPRHVRRDQIAVQRVREAGDQRL